MENINPAQFNHYQQLIGQLFEFHKHGLFQDCIIHLKDGHKVKVHRLILASMSHLLKCIFQYDFGDENSPIPVTSGRCLHCLSNRSVRDTYTFTLVDEANDTTAASRMGGDSRDNPTIRNHNFNYINHGEGDINDNASTSSADSSDSEHYTNHVILLRSHVCNSIEIHLNVSLEIMTLIIDYAYTGMCNITWQNIDDLLASANEYEIISLLKLCVQFLEANLTINNCIGIHVNAKQYFCKELFDNTKIFILQNFEKIAKNTTNSELLDIPYDEFYDILSDDHLNCHSEETVFGVIKNWIEHDITKRLQHLDKLLTTTRFGFLTKAYCLNTILEWSVLQTTKVSECLFFILLKATEIVINLSSQDTTEHIKSLCELYGHIESNDELLLQHELSSNLDFNTRPRVPNDVVFVVGGWSDGSTTNIIETYDPRAKVWLKMKCTEFNRAYHGCVTINNKIYVLGGFDGDTFYNTVKCFDPLTYKWEDKACMNFRRCYISVVNNSECRMTALKLSNILLLPLPL